MVSQGEDMGKNIWGPSKVWEGFEVDAEINKIEEVSIEQYEFYKKSIYRYMVEPVENILVNMSAEVYTPSNEEIAGVLLLIPEYHKQPTSELIESLIEKKYKLVIPDISATSAYPTDYPIGLSHCIWENAKKGKIYTLEKNSKDTCQYMYSYMVKRTINFIEQELKNENIILVGLGTACDIAMQVAGSAHKNIVALACLNGCGYGEYQDSDKFLKIEGYDEEKMAWLSGVSAIAYAKNITIPSFIALGANSKKGNLDRIEEIEEQMPQGSLSLVFGHGVSDYLSPKMYLSFVSWLSALSHNTYIPDNPEIGIRVNEENKLYVDVCLDRGIMPENVVIYYCFDEDNNQIRDWRPGKTAYTGNNEFVCAPKIGVEEAAKIYVYAEVTYLTGLSLCSKVAMKDVSKLYSRLTNEKDKESDLTLIYQPSEGIGSFVESFEGDVLIKSDLRVKKNDLGLKGITGAKHAIKTYKIRSSVIDNTKTTIQINVGTDVARNMSITLLCVKDGELEIFQTSKTVEASGNYFLNYQIDIKDFKDSKMMPISQGHEVKAMIILVPDAFIGNILLL